MKHRSLKMSPFLFASTFLLFAPPLLATEIGTECSSDADCSEGGICQKNMWTNGCAAPSEDGAEKCDTTVHESETGFCYVPPEQCTSDAECGEYLSCIEESSGSCTGSSDGETICTETKGSSYCGTASVACDSDADCPRSFECVEAPVICLDIGCPEDAPDCNRCESDGRKECRPQQIDCESDSDCPSEWSCFDTVSYECPDEEAPPPTDSGDGGGEDSSEKGDRAMPAPEGGSSGELPIAPDGGDDPPECVAVPVTGSCYPDVWNGGGGDLAAGEADPTTSRDDDLADKPPTDGAAPSEAEQELARSEEEGGGCSVGPASPRGTSWWLALLLVLPALRRRAMGAEAVQRSQSS